MPGFISNRLSSIGPVLRLISKKEMVSFGARSVAEHLSLDRVMFLPSASPPHKSAAALSEPGHRAEMVRLAIAGDELFEFSDFDLNRPGPSYTVDTVAHFREACGADADLYWIIGADSLAELANWHRVGDLVDACHVVTAGRSGCEEFDVGSLRHKLTEEQIDRLRSGMMETRRIEIGATDLRRRARQGLSLRYLVPEKVVAYIRRHGLYRG